MRRLIVLAAVCVLPAGGAGAAHAQSAWTVDRVPILTVGVDAPPALARPIGATRLADGTLVVADGAENTIHLFGPDGRLRRSIARPGDGPGEFRFLAWFGRCGADSLVGWDFVQRRVSVFDPAGGFARSYHLTLDPSTHTPLTLACGRSGTMAYQPMTGPEGATVERPVGRSRARIAIRVPGDSAVHHTPERAGLELMTVGGGGGPAPLGRATWIAVGSDRLYVGTADSALIEVFGLDGRAMPPIRFRLALRPPTRAHLEASVEDILGMFPGGARERVRAPMMAVPMPATLPAYSGLLLDPDELLWVVTSHPGDPDTRLLVMDRSGRQVATVTVPAVMRPAEVGRDYLLGIGESADGEPQVMLFRLRRGS